MYRNTITLVVLSEEPIPERMDIGDVAREYDVGDFVLHSTALTSEKISDEEMARELLDAGSDPGFFQLDHIDA